jgi:dTDP-4-dehydrorhamnose reductase
LIADDGRQHVKALVTGGGGQLASDLAERLPDALVLPRTELDITDDDAVARAVERAQPEVVFNCAAFHNVDVCEREEDRSFEVNARAVKRLGQRCEQDGATLVHVSTNYVFDGRRPEPYVEDDRPNPRSIYALSKLAGEYAALAYCSNAIVVRSAGLYGHHGSASKGGNFVQRMIARARDQGQLKMVADQRLNPTFTADLADGVIEAVEKRATGILHITNSEACSWYDFTVEIMRLSGIDVPIEAVDTTPGGVDRPLNGVLARSRTDTAPLRSWREALAGYLGS